MRLGFRPGRSTKDCFGDAPEPHHYKREGRNPDRCDATRFGRHRRERPRIGQRSPAETEGDPDGEIADDAGRSPHSRPALNQASFRAQWGKRHPCRA